MTGDDSMTLRSRCQEKCVVAYQQRQNS